MPATKPPTCAQNATPPWLESAEHAAQQLKDEPQAEQPAGPDGVQEHEAERDDHVHPGVREEDQIGAEHARDRAAGADHRDLRGRIGQRLGEGRGNAAQQVEKEEAGVAEMSSMLLPNTQR